MPARPCLLLAVQAGGQAGIQPFNFEYSGQSLQNKPCEIIPFGISRGKHHRDYACLPQAGNL